MRCYRVTSKLLVNELRHIEKCRLNADRSPHVGKKKKKTLGKMTAILLKWDATRQLPAERTHALTKWTNRQTEDDTTSHRPPPSPLNSSWKTTNHAPGNALTGFWGGLSSHESYFNNLSETLWQKICPPTTLMGLIYYVSKQQCLGLKGKMVSFKRKQKFRWLFLFAI